MMDRNWGRGNRLSSGSNGQSSQIVSCRILQDDDEEAIAPDSGVPDDRRGRSGLIPSLVRQPRKSRHEYLVARNLAR